VGSPHVGALAYDAIAAGYDAHVEGDAWMRRVLHAHYARVFRPGQCVLDVGCGTATDAIFLAQRGLQVVAIDFSPEMIAQARAKIAAAGVGDMVRAEVLPIADMAQLDTPFDGLISAFAGLSTLPDLAQFAADAATLVHPRGHLVLHLLNRFSLWELLGYLQHGNWPAARQVGHLRTREFTIGGQPVRHTLYFGREAYRRYFARHFVLGKTYALGALRPPHTVNRIPRDITTALESLDVRTGAWPLLRDAGRFFVLDLQRLPT
jgi:SAM-dependent methyltransferase